MMKLILLVLYLVVKGEGKSFSETRHKRATCAPEFEKISDTHSACRDPSTEAVPNPFTPEEAAVILQQTIAYRAKENASAMMKPVWDDDIAFVAQKWSDVCGELGPHESNPLDRLVPSLMGIYMGQNVFAGTDSGMPFELATDMWHDEIQYFVYGTGAVPANEVIGHYTQVVLNDVSKIGCGRTTCGDGIRVVCNYAEGQLTPDLITPFDKCEDASCKLNCYNRTETLCDCNGLMCLNSGVLDKTTCTCRCKEFFSGPSCETVDCVNIPADASSCSQEQCWYRGATCPRACGLCNTACDTVTCDNGGTMNTFTCTCACPEGFSGDTCSIPDSTCSLTCENGGTLNPDTCSCTCTSEYTGDNCTLPDNPYCTLLRDNGYCAMAVWGPFCCPGTS